MLSPIIVYILAALISGVSGYAISYRFNKSSYAANNKSGDFGTPRGGFFALMSGMLIGMIALRLVSGFEFFPQEAIGTSFIIAMVVGAAAGVAGMFTGLKKRPKE